MCLNFKVPYVGLYVVVSIPVRLSRQGHSPQKVQATYTASRPFLSKKASSKLSLSPVSIR